MTEGNVYDAYEDSRPDAPDSERTIPRAIVTKSIIAVNVAVFIVMVLTTGGEALGHASSNVVKMFGANFSYLTLTTGQYWRLITSAFVHSGIVHLGVNMYMIWVMGSVLEEFLGPTKFLAVYVIAATAGGLASIIWDPAVTSVGASGAALGLIGGLMSVYVMRKGEFSQELARNALIVTLFFAGYNILAGFMQTGVDNAAHIGGFIAGMIASACLMPRWLGDGRWSKGDMLKGAPLVCLLALLMYLANDGRFDGSGRMAFSRARHLLAEGNVTDAIEHLNASIKANPADSNDAFGYRGCILFTSANADADAIDDILHNIRARGCKSRDDGFLGIVCALAYLRMNDPDRARGLLFEIIQHCDNEWPVLVARYVLGEIDAKTLLTYADDNEKMTEAKTYIGYMCLMQGNKYEAGPCFQWVVEKGNRNCLEYFFSRQALSRLSGTAL